MDPAPLAGASNDVGRPQRAGHSTALPLDGRRAFWMPLVGAMAASALISTGVALWLFS